ncbi:MAG: GntR family transcriptional regulator [Pirellulales bacterium]|nr:GntR family transcriptional regulator [Pirellulales bacterium]
MSNAIDEISPINQLVKRLEQDIQRRRLSPGDRYISAAGAGKLLGVSTSTAHRALQLLAERDVVTRYQKRGTFIGPKVIAGTQSDLRVVHVLLNDGMDPRRLQSDAFFQGIIRELPEASVQFTTLPSVDPAGFLRKTVCSEQRSEELVGIIAFSCPREVYRFLSDAVVPAVIYGSPYSGNTALPSFDVDNFEAGRLLTEHLLAEGHCRIVVISSAQGRPGENDFLDGITEAITKARMPANTLVVRMVPDEYEVFSDATRQMLESEDDRIAFVTRGREPAKFIDRAVMDFGSEARQRAQVAFFCDLTNMQEPCPYLHVQTKETLQEVVVAMARILKLRAEGKVVEPKHVVSPVELVLPSR